LDFCFFCFKAKEKIRKEKFKDEVVKPATINQQQSTRR
jgi:hypothetical protein